MSNYGEILATYRGTGELHLPGSLDTQCRFEALQVRDGTVVVRCETTDGTPGWVLGPTVRAEFSGTTVDGRTICAHDLLRIGYLPIDRETESRYAFWTSGLEVRLRESATSFTSRFDVTNLTLASPSTNIGHPAAEEVWIERTNGYAERQRRLSVTKCVDVTAHLVVRAPSLDVRQDVADDVCYLLSIARGTKVQWIARVDLSGEGAAVRCYHGPRVTKRYSPLAVINPWRPDDTEVFLRTAMPQYLVQKSKWGLAGGLVDVYLDAKAEADYLELRGTKLAVAMEMLKEAFVAATGQSHFVRPKAEFKKLRSLLERELSGFLSGHGWQDTERAMVYRNLDALNRIPFAEKLGELCEHLGLSLSGREISLFAQCRDSLVHRGRFYCQTADEAQRQSVPPHKTPVEEHHWLLGVLDRVFLRILGYRGPYIDYSGGAGSEPPIRKETF